MASPVHVSMADSDDEIVADLLAISPNNDESFDEMAEIEMILASNNEARQKLVTLMSDLLNETEKEKLESEIQANETKNYFQNEIDGLKNDLNVAHSEKVAIEKQKKEINDDACASRVLICGLSYKLLDITKDLNSYVNADHCETGDNVKIQLPPNAVNDKNADDIERIILSESEEDSILPYDSADEEITIEQNESEEKLSVAVKEGAVQKEKETEYIVTEDESDVEKENVQPKEHLVTPPGKVLIEKKATPNKNEAKPKKWYVCIHCDEVSFQKKSLLAKHKLEVHKIKQKKKAEKRALKRPHPESDGGEENDRQRLVVSANVLRSLNKKQSMKMRKLCSPN